MLLVERPERTLYQFPISHYCEKTRWNLDAKGLPYETRNLLPGAHLLWTRILGRGNTVPLLIDHGVAVSDSTAIAFHLERVYPDVQLIPAAGPDRVRALELEATFDRVGESVRAWLYGQLATEPGAIASVFFRQYAPMIRRVGEALGPVLRTALVRRYNLTRGHLESARADMLHALERLERETDSDPSRYLVGRSLTIADIAAASLLGPLVAAPESPWAAADAGPLPPVLVEMREAVRHRSAGAWILQRYQFDRNRRAMA